MSKLQKDFGGEYLLNNFKKSQTQTLSPAMIQIYKFKMKLEEHEIKLLKIKKDNDENLFKILQQKQ